MHAHRHEHLSRAAVVFSWYANHLRNTHTVSPYLFTLLALLFSRDAPIAIFSADPMSIPIFANSSYNSVQVKEALRKKREKTTCFHLVSQSNPVQWVCRSSAGFVCWYVEESQVPWISWAVWLEEWMIQSYETKIYIMPGGCWYWRMNKCDGRTWTTLLYCYYRYKWACCSNVVLFLAVAVTRSVWSVKLWRATWTNACM